MKNVAQTIVGQVIISVYNENTPTTEESRELVAVLKGLDHERMRSLTFTKGGTPSPAQRRELTEVLGGKQFVTAVVSDARMVRGVVTAMSWFNSAIKAYSSAELEEAFRYLQVPTTQWDLIRREARKLHRLLGIEPTI